MSSEKTPAHRGITRKIDDRTPPTDSDSPDIQKKTRTDTNLSLDTSQPSFDEENEPVFDNPDFDKLKSWFIGQFNLIKIEMGLTRTENAELKQELNGIRKELDVKDRLIADLDANLGVMQNELQSSVNLVSTLKTQLETLQQELEELQQYSRRMSLRIFGLPQFKPDDNYRQMVVDLARDIGVVLDLSDIDRAHPAGKDSKQLIIKFTNFTARSNLFSNRRKFKDVNRKIYVNEDLTPYRASLFRSLLELKKSKVIANAWTNDCRLFAWKDQKKILIKTVHDVNSLQDP
jgi:hypothetical protein